MLKICYVEDSDITYSELENNIKRLKIEKNLDLVLVRFNNAEDFLKETVFDYQILLMDIELPGMNGMDAAKKFREAGHNNLLIFVTNLAQYAVNGYSVNAFDFIVKPVSYFDLSMKLDRAMKSLHLEKVVEFAVSLRGVTSIINSAKLTYVEIDRHNLIYHMTDGDVRIIGSMKEAMKQLEGCPFELCNQCYLVNLSYVSQLNKTDIIVNGEKLIVSAPRKKSFTIALMKYLESVNK